jgi:hypothetical protein
VAVDLTTSGVLDKAHMPAVLGRVPNAVRQVSSDRAFNSGIYDQAVLARGSVPPPMAQCSPKYGPRPAYVQGTARDALVPRNIPERYARRTGGGATRQRQAENVTSHFKVLVCVGARGADVRIAASWSIARVPHPQSDGITRNFEISEVPAGLICPDDRRAGASCAEPRIHDNAEHHANRIADAPRYSTGTVRKHANDRL